MADYGRDGSDHGNTKNVSKSSTYEKRAKVWSWQIIVWMGLIINAHLDLGGVFSRCVYYVMCHKSLLNFLYRMY